MRARHRWPSTLTLVRHGESAGNVARELAESRGHDVIDIAVRDMDVPLSDRGHRQSVALGDWLAGPRRRIPAVVLASPYVRAVSTARLALAAADLATPVVIDERLREREFGILDRLTRAGIEARFPDQAEARSRVGKFYHRPPGGESWCDVALRVRSVLDTVSREHDREHVLVVAHQVVVLMFCAVLLSWDEQAVLDADRREELANCSVTTFVRRRGRATMELERFNDVEALAGLDAPVTHEPDVPVAPR
jgi:broad specificity phosphatase PhoE